MKLVMITPRVGTSDTLLAFIPDWIRQLARQVDYLWVVTTRLEPVDLPENTKAIEVGRDYSRGETVLNAIFNFHRTLWYLTKHERVDGIFAHMYPKFAIMAAPYARLHHLPLVLWFTHTNVSWQLRLAGTLVDRILTAAPETCHLRSPKVFPVGHGIDTNGFSRTAEPSNHNGSILLTVGRISPIKNLHTIIEATHILVHKRNLREIKLILAGAPPRSDQSTYMADLQNQVSGLNLQDHIKFLGEVEHTNVPQLFSKADVFVSACNSGVDKAILEAMAGGLPVVISNPAFKPILGELADQLMYPPNNGEVLAERLEFILGRSAEERRALGKSLQDIVKSSHNISALMRQVVQAFEDIGQSKQHNQRGS